MNKFNRGDLIRCIDHDYADGFVTNHHIYEVQEDTIKDNDFVTILNDSGIKQSLFSYRFGLVDGCREQIAKKQSNGKTPFDILFRIPALREVAEVFGMGEKKYPSIDGDFNWRKGKGSSEYKMKLMGACLRHCFAYMTGEKLDKESGRSHLAHAACNLLMVADLDTLEA